MEDNDVRAATYQFLGNKSLGLGGFCFNCFLGLLSGY